MSLECTDACSGEEVPEDHLAVPTCADEVGALEADGVDGSFVSPEGTYAVEGGAVPDAD